MRNLLPIVVLLTASLVAHAQEPTVAPPAPAAAPTPPAPAAPPPAPPPPAELLDEDAPLINRLPPDVRQQLTARQIENILEREIRSKGNNPAVEIIVPAAFFLCVIGVVVAVLLAGLRRQKQLHETLRSMIEKGVDIPPAMLVTPKEPPNDRRRGIVLLALGCGLSAFLFVVDKQGTGAWALGLVPLFLGLGYLLAWGAAHKDTPPS